MSEAEVPPTTFWEEHPSTIRLEVGDGLKSIDRVREWLDRRQNLARFVVDQANDRILLLETLEGGSKEHALEAVSRWVVQQAQVAKFGLNVNEWVDRIEVRNRVSGPQVKSEPFVAERRSDGTYRVMGRAGTHLGDLRPSEDGWYGHDAHTRFNGMLVVSGPKGSPHAALQEMIVKGAWT